MTGGPDNPNEIIIATHSGAKYTINTPPIGGGDKVTYILRMVKTEQKGSPKYITKVFSTSMALTHF